MSILLVSERTIDGSKYLKVMAGEKLQTFPYDVDATLVGHCHACAEMFIKSWNEDNAIKLALGDAHKLPESSGLIGYVFIVNKANKNVKPAI